MNVPEEEKFLNTEKEIRAMLVEFVAGRAAEELVFDTVTTGAGQRYREGDQSRQSDDYAVRHVQTVRPYGA